MLVMMIFAALFAPLFVVFSRTCFVTLSVARFDSYTAITTGCGNP
jgi:hypothetical protein